MTTPERDRGAVIGAGLRQLALWSVWLVAIAVGVYVIGWVLGAFWVILFPVVIALILATILGPPAAYLRHKGWPSTLAAVVVVVGSLLVIVAVIAALTPSVAGQIGDIASQASAGLTTVQNWLTDGPINLSDGQLTAAINAVQERLKSSAADIGAGVFSTLSAATSAVVNLVLIFMLTFFFVKDGHRFLPWLENLSGQRTGRHLTEVSMRCWDTLGGFIRTQALVSLIDAVLIGAALLILQVQLAVPLAVITFFGGFVPIVGAFVSGAVAVLVTLVTNDPRDALIMLIVIIAVQQLEGNVLSPWLQGKNMNLHAAVVLLSVTAGGTLFGITGAFLAVPAVATAAELLRYVNEQIDRAVGPSAPDEDSHATDDPQGEPTPSEA